FDDGAEIRTPLVDTDARVVVRAWTSGTSPSRRFVVAWESGGSSVQLQVVEGVGVVRFAAPAPPPIDQWARSGLLEAARAAARRVRPPVPVDADVSTCVFTPRSVLCNSPDAAHLGASPRWLDVRRESLTGPGSAKGACYV